MIALFEKLDKEGEINLHDKLDTQHPAKWGVEFSIDGVNYEAFEVEKEEGLPEIRIYPVRSLGIVGKKEKEEIDSKEDLLKVLKLADNYKLGIG